MNFQALANIHAACFVTPAPWPAADIAAIAQSSGAFVETTSGGFLIGRVAADEAELLTLAVAPDLRRIGQGRALVAQFFATAQSLGASRFFLEVAAQNAAAIALYHTSGFHESGRRKNYYRTPDRGFLDAIVMSKTQENVK